MHLGSLQQGYRCRCIVLSVIAVFSAACSSKSAYEEPPSAPLAPKACCSQDATETSTGGFKEAELRTNALYRSKRIVGLAESCKGPLKKPLPAGSYFRVLASDPDTFPWYEIVISDGLSDRRMWLNAQGVPASDFEDCSELDEDVRQQQQQAYAQQQADQCRIDRHLAFNAEKTARKAYEQQAAQQHAREMQRAQIAAENALRIEVQQVAKEYVRARLKSPATATFCNLSVRTEIWNDGRDPMNPGVVWGGAVDYQVYIVTGSTDSQNSFGALLRSDFSCVVTKSGNVWRLVNLFIK